MVADQPQRLQFLTWERTAEDIAAPSQIALKEKLSKIAGAHFSDTSYVAEDARIFTTYLKMGAHSWIAGHALVRGHVTFGDNCSVNPYACISGSVRLQTH